MSASSRVNNYNVGGEQQNKIDNRRLKSEERNYIGNSLSTASRDVVKIRQFGSEEVRRYEYAFDDNDDGSGTSSSSEDKYTEDECNERFKIARENMERENVLSTQFETLTENFVMTQQVPMPMTHATYAEGDKIVGMHNHPTYTNLYHD